MSSINGRRTLKYKNGWFEKYNDNILQQNEKIVSKYNKSNIQLNDLIATGSYGKIYKIKNNNTKIYKSIQSNNNSELRQEYNSLIFHYKLQNDLKTTPYLKYICELLEYGKYKNKKNIYVIMNNCGIELKQYILNLKNNNKLTLNKIIYIMQECCNALKIIHNYGYCHLDIKPENFLVFNSNGKLQIKIIDFGFVTKIGTNRYGTGTPSYTAPELYCKNNMVSPSSDIFSLGCMFYQFLLILYFSYNSGIFNNLFVCPYAIRDYFLYNIYVVRADYNEVQYEADIQYMKGLLNNINPNNDNNNTIILNIIKKMIYYSIEIKNKNKNKNNQRYFFIEKSEGIITTKYYGLLPDLEKIKINNDSKNY